MDTSTSFDLNAEVDRWRQTLSQSPAIDADDLDELESHLRETLTELEAKGLSPEEGFLVACRRLGPPAPLQAEFAKVNPGGVWLHRTVWMLVGIQVWTLIGGLSRLAADAVLLGGLAVTGDRFSGQAGSVSSALLPGGVHLLAQAVVMTVMIGTACLLLAGSRRRRPAERPAVHPAVLLWSILGLTFANLALYVWNFVWPQLTVRLFSAEQFGWIAYSKSLASWVLVLVQTLLMAVLTFLLARHVFGRGRKQPFTAQSR